MEFVFEAKSGVFGEYGWKRISFWRWLILFPDHVTKSRVRGIKCTKKKST